MSKKLVILTFISLCASAAQKPKVDVQHVLDVVTSAKPVQAIIAGYLGQAFAQIDSIDLEEDYVNHPFYLYHLVCNQNKWSSMHADLSCLLETGLTNGVGNRDQNHTCKHGNYVTVDVRSAKEPTHVAVAPIKVSSSDERYCAKSIKGGNISLLDMQAHPVSKFFGLATRTLKVKEAQDDGRTHALCFSPDGNYFASCTASELNLWDLSSDRLIWSFNSVTAPGFFHALFFLPGNLGIHLYGLNCNKIILINMPTQLEK